MLFSETRKRAYVGCAQDVAKRHAEHNANRVRSTKGGAPWRVVHIEPVGSYGDARRRELYYKSGAGRRRLAKILEEHAERCQSG